MDEDSNLIKPNPVPGTGGEGLQGGVGNHGIKVCTPVSLSTDVDQRGVVHLLQLGHAIKSVRRRK